MASHPARECIGCSIATNSDRARKVACNDRRAAERCPPAVPSALTRNPFFARPSCHARLLSGRDAFEVADVRGRSAHKLTSPRRRRPNAAGMIFRAADAVNDLRPLSRRAPQESASLTASTARNLRRQAIDGAVRPWRYRSSLRSWDYRGRRLDAWWRVSRSANSFRLGSGITTTREQGDAIQITPPRLRQCDFSSLHERIQDVNLVCCCTSSRHVSVSAAGISLLKLTERNQAHETCRITWIKSNLNALIIVLKGNLAFEHQCIASVLGIRPEARVSWLHCVSLCLSLLPFSLARWQSCWS